MTTWPQCIVMESVTESFPVLVLHYEALCRGSENVICLVVQQASCSSPSLYRQSLLFDRRQRSVCGVFPELPCSKPIIRHFSPIFSTSSFLSNFSFHHISLSSLTSTGNSTPHTYQMFSQLIRLVTENFFSSTMFLAFFLSLYVCLSLSSCSCLSYHVSSSF